VVGSYLHLYYTCGEVEVVLLGSVEERDWYLSLLDQAFSCLIEVGYGRL